MNSYSNNKNYIKRSVNKKETSRKSQGQLSTEYLFDDISSESSIGGRRFLKNPQIHNRESVVRNLSPATTEDENTEDLLTPFNARKTPISLSQHSTEKTSGNKRSTSSNVAKSKMFDRNLVDDNLSSEMLVIQENGENDLNRISVMTFNDEDSLVDLTKDVRNESKMSFLDDQLILSVDELMNENSTACESYRSSGRNNKSYNEKSLSEIEEAIDYEKSQSQYNTTNTSIQKSTKTPEVSNHKSQVRSIRGECISDERSHHFEDSEDNDSTEDYSDDFENEQETAHSTKEDNKYALSPPLSLEKRDEKTCPADQKLRHTVSKGTCSKAGEIKVSFKQKSENSIESPLKTDVEVQTLWSGDFPRIHSVPQILPINRYENIIPPPTNNTLKIQSITSSLINYQILEKMTNYNPCLTALDNVLKQQINLTREFITTQRNLHDTISKAISQCVTNDYAQQDGTIQIMLKNYTRK
ncbi:unnamed protein product [Trichobilharzia szidati]|nr:unnamed protein product [Trichobilharzia szidati]